jgi:hypothetical protein
MPSLYFFRDFIAFEASGADFQGNGGPCYFGFHFYQIGPPGAAGMIFSVAHLVAGNRMFPANIAYS